MSDEARELKVIIEATRRMHSATDRELVDLLASIPHDLYCDLMRSHLNEYSNTREHLSNSASIRLRQFAHDYFMKKVDREMTK